VNEIARQDRFRVEVKSRGGAYHVKMSSSDVGNRLIERNVEDPKRFDEGIGQVRSTRACTK